MYIRSVNIQTNRTIGYPYDTEAIRYAKNISLDQRVTFIVGDNGVGKSTLIETIACKLNLPRINSMLGFQEKSFEPIRDLVENLDESLEIDLIQDPSGFFFRSEDFGDYVLNSNESFKKNMLYTYGQNLSSFSHGQAFFHIFFQKMKCNGLFILDEPENAMSPLHQIDMIYLIKKHLEDFDSQFIITTHSPILMAMPDAVIYQITKKEIKKTRLEEVDHYVFAKNFLNNPRAFFREFDEVYKDYSLKEDTEGWHKFLQRF